MLATRPYLWLKPTEYKRNQVLSSSQAAICNHNWSIEKFWQKYVITIQLTNGDQELEKTGIKKMLWSEKMQQVKEKS